jgi:hypothetical protein
MSTLSIWIATAIAGLTLAFGSGWVVCNKQHDSERLAHANKIISVNQQIQSLSSTISNLTANETQHVITRYKTLVQTVYQYIPDSNYHDDCNLSNDTVGLLNTAVAGDLSRSTR